jgi:hypothetical protein
MRISMLALLLLAAMWTWAKPGDVVQEEFLGPFPSWANVQADYGAVGDGKADDTAAIQKGLDDLRKGEFPKRVLYFPAGTYRITGTLQVLRATHNESQGVAFLGEDPLTTTIVWDGPADGSMVQYDPWFSVLGRLTFDGKRKAKTAIDFYGGFSTCNEISDLIIKDVQFGIEAGHMDSAGMAETAVLRCRFYRCAKAAISIQNFNSLDWYIWHSWFENCGIGVTNEFGAGNFHVYQSTFLRSKEADATIKHTGYFTLYGNTSIGSKLFLHAKRHPMWQDTETWGANFTLQKNRIITPVDATPIRFENNGPLMLLDNEFSLRVREPAMPAIYAAAPSEQVDVISIGNRYMDSIRTLLDVKGRVLSVDDTKWFTSVGPDITAQSIEKKLVPVPFAPIGKHPVIEVAKGADGAIIQAAIDAAMKLKGLRPVVHLPAGMYQLKQTLTIPAGSDMQLVGDGLIQATSLNWTGDPKGGPLLRIDGPTHAAVRSVYINAPNTVRAIEAVKLDQPGARVFMEQGQTYGYEYGLVVDGLDNAYVALNNHGHNAVQVLGGETAVKGKRPAGITALFCGASSRHTHHKVDGIDLYNIDKGGRLLIRDIWYEGQIWHFLNLTGSGEFTYHAGIVAPYAPPTPADSVLKLENFRGKLTLTQIEPNNGPFRIVGGGKETKMLALGLIMRQMPLLFEQASPDAKIAVVNSRLFRENGTGTDSLPDVGKADPAFLREMLATLRTELPKPLTEIKDGVTDLRFYRIMVNGLNGVVLKGQ